MDRVLIYPGQIPLDTDLLSVQRNAMEAIGLFLQASVGTTMVASGLACAPTAPASMQVTVGQGCIVSQQTVDASAFGSLAADTTDSLVKLGLNLSPTTFTLTAPVTSGQSVNYLIEATFTETDDTPVTLPYYNSSNPAQPFSGANNNGVAQNTRRAQKVSLQLKAGTAANTGTQATPAVDSGWVGLWVVTVNFGQVTVTSGAIAKYPNAPFLVPYTSSHHHGVPGEAPKVDLATEVQGILPLANMTTVRTVLLTNLTLFVNGASGNDSNTGLTSGTAFKTIQAAINSLYKLYDLAGFTATISIAAGTYTAGGALTGAPVGTAPTSGIAITGAGSASTIISITSGNCLQATLAASVSVSGLQFAATGSNATGYGLFASNGGNIVIGTDVAFGFCGTAAIGSNTGADIGVNHNYTILAGGSSHYLAAFGGTISSAGVTATLSGTPAFTSAFAAATTCGVIDLLSMTFAGTGATGPRYSASSNGVIATNGGGASYFPGSTAGATSTGGQYT